MGCVRKKGKSWNAQVRISVPEVALISGHKDVRQLFRYTHLKPENLIAKYSSIFWLSISYSPRSIRVIEIIKQIKITINNFRIFFTFGEISFLLSYTNLKFSLNNVA